MLQNRAADARPMTNVPNGAAALSSVERVRPRIVAGLVLVAWLMLAGVRRTLGPVMR